MKNIFSFFFNCIFITTLLAQPNIEWQRSFGGSNFDEARCIQQTSDGGYILTGYTVSIDGDVIGNHGGIDFWVVKLSDTGMLQWSKVLGGSDNDWAFSVQQTKDGGYIVAGHTRSNDGDVSGNHGDKDCWVVKLNNIGDIEWQKSFGGSGWDEAWCVRQTSDDGYIIAGRSSSLDGDVTGNHGGLDYWVVKMNTLGVIEWQKSFGGSENDIAYSIRQTLDGGYIVTGETDSNNGQITGSQGGTDYWVVKLSASGNMEWQKALGSTSLDRSNDIYQTQDGGYIVVGQASQNNGNVTGWHGIYDYWVVKLSKIGEIEWQKALGGSSPDFCTSIQQTNDGGYVIAGDTQSTNGDVLDNDGGQDIWIVKLTNSGEIEWQKTLGGTQAEWGSSIQQTSDGGYIVAGYNWSNDGDATSVHGYDDFWVVKLSPEGAVGVDNPFTNEADHLDISPNPANQYISIKAASEEPSLTICISDLLGRQLSQQIIPNGGQADIAILPKGIFWVVATTPSGKVYSNKFLKE